MSSNPYLSGACTQNRCPVCNRLLAAGVCLEGCRLQPANSPMDHTAPSADHTFDGEVRISTLDPPVFSDAQRQQAAANITERIPADEARDSATLSNAQEVATALPTPAEPNCQTEASAAVISRKRRAHGDAHSVMHRPLSGGHPVPKRRPGRPLLSTPRAGSTRAEAAGDKTPAPPGEICEITHEPVNVQAVAGIASRRAAGFLRLPGSNMTVREMAFYFLQCCSRRDTYENGMEIGILTVVWRESKCEQEFGVKTRRYSGFEPFICVEGAGGSHRGRFLTLLKQGVPACLLGRSFFAVSKLLRWAARTEVPGMDIDQVNSHFNLQLRRHPDARCLGRYTQQREQVLEKVMSKMGGDIGDEQKRDAAKELFIILGYGGGTDTWCNQYGVAKGALPSFTHEFAQEQRALRQCDVLAQPDLHAMARNSGHHRPNVKVQATLNLQGEREALDAMEAGLRQSDVSEVASYEHDGVFVWLPPWAEASVANVAQWKRETLSNARGGDPRVQLKEKVVPSYDEIVGKFKERFGGDWGTIVHGWEEQFNIIQEARPGAAQAKQDRLYAEIVSRDAEPYAGHTFSVRDLFKHTGKGNYFWYSVDEQKWRNPDGRGRDKLLHLISMVLARSLGGRWLNEFGDTDIDAILGEPSAMKADTSTVKLFDNSTVVERVEKMSRALLIDPNFELDGEETRKYLRFTNGVFDMEEMEMREPSPEMRLTNSTEWAYEGSGLPREAEQRLEQTLQRVALEERDGLSPDCEEQLESLRDNFPDLGFIFSVCGSWTRALYCLKHLARATFALKYQDMLVTRGPGGNGKDTLANRIAVLLGTYFTNLDSKALTVNRDMDAASHTFLALKAKRFVCVRELEKHATIKGNIYRTVSDYKNKIKARPLYGDDEEFYPHFLLFACTNVPLEIDDKGRGSKRRTRILDMPYNFVEYPAAANEKRIVPDIEDRFPEWNPSFFFLLCKVRQILMSRPAGEVQPVPEEVKEAVDEEMREPWMDDLDAFVRSRLEPVSQIGLASSAADVREAFHKRCEGLEKREVGLKMAAQGFKEESKSFYDVTAHKRTTKRVYRLVFPGGVESQVKLI